MMEQNQEMPLSMTDRLFAIHLNEDNRHGLPPEDDIPTDESDFELDYDIPVFECPTYWQTQSVLCSGKSKEIGIVRPSVEHMAENPPPKKRKLAALNVSLLY
jgi:hypothetical protein